MQNLSSPFRGSSLQFKLSPPQKAAIILAALGPDYASEILKKMDEGSVVAFAQAMSALDSVPATTLERVIEEFLQSILGEGGVAFGVIELKKYLSTIMNVENMNRVIRDLQWPKGRTIWEKLSNCDEKAICDFLSREHAQVSALVLARMKPAKAARILERLNDEYAELVVNRMSRPVQPTQESMAPLIKILSNDIVLTARTKDQSRNPDELIGNMMNFVAQSKREPILKKLEQVKPEFAQAVQRKMFTFSDIPLRIDSGKAGLIVKSVDNTVFLKALKLARQTDARAAAFFMNNISKRLSEQLEDQLQDAPPVSTKDAEAAQSEIVKVVQLLAAEGKLVITDPGDTEQFL
jgi:flagellar motor switch protein FliG